ncbi:MAG: TrkA family potassium uptake protein [Blautia sp.]|nr:TrkA family potassium uptake protein [Blautia sp.]
MKSILLVGVGRFGRYTAKKLYELGHQVMAVDKDESSLEKVMPYCSDGLIGDATEKELLKGLGIPDFDLCIVGVGDAFLESLEITSLLKELGGKVVVSRATSRTQEKFLLRNGADSVVFPEKQLASWTAIRYGSDNIENYIELTDGYAIYEVQIPSQWDKKRIDEIDVRRRYGINILGIRGAKMNMNPSYDAVLHKEETILVLGQNAQLQKIFHI